MSEVIELALYRTNLDGSLPDKSGGQSPTTTLFYFGEILGDECRSEY